MTQHLCGKTLERNNVRLSSSEEVCMRDRVSKVELKLDRTHSVGAVTRCIMKEHTWSSLSDCHILVGRFSNET